MVSCGAVTDDDELFQELGSYDDTKIVWLDCQELGRTKV